MEALSGALAAATLILVVHHRRWFLRLARRRTSRTVECCGCGRPLPIHKAVVIHGQVHHEQEGGSVTIAEYHRRCARRADHP